MDLPNLSGSELVERWRAGSQSAAAVLMDRYSLRLVALIASRLNRRLRDSIEPEDVVQSAMGSFFRYAQCNPKARSEIKSAVSVWNLLAVFARRKLSRSLERATAAKRGGHVERTAWNQVELTGVGRAPQSYDAEALLADLNEILVPDQFQLLEMLFAGSTQAEIADKLAVDERTVRRRVTKLRKVLAPRLLSEPELVSTVDSTERFNITLPRINYSQFVLGKMIGSGGFGKVYRARMQAENLIVAVKFMHRHLWTDARAKHSFLQEVDHASRVSHSGIIRYKGWGESPHGGPYIVSELIDGQSLNKLQHASEEQLVKFLRQVCEALSAAHEAGVVHGDLTPENVLIAADGRVVITDFGLATTVHRHTSAVGSVPNTNSPGGTIGFAAPEQIAASFGRLGPSTDIYAVGGLAYFCLTGQAPHTLHDISASLADTISDRDPMLPQSPAQTRAALKLAQVARLALRKAVAARPSNVKGLIALLDG